MKVDDRIFPYKQCLPTFKVKIPRCENILNDLSMVPDLNKSVIPNLALILLQKIVNKHCRFIHNPYGRYCEDFANIFQPFILGCIFCRAVTKEFI